MHSKRSPDASKHKQPLLLLVDYSHGWCPYSKTTAGGGSYPLAYPPACAFIRPTDALGDEMDKEQEKQHAWLDRLIAEQEQLLGKPYFELLKAATEAQETIDLDELEQYATTHDRGSYQP